MLATLLALTLSQHPTKLELLECASYEDKAEQAACVEDFDERRKRATQLLKSSN